MASLVRTKTFRNLEVVLHLATSVDFSDAEWAIYLAAIEELRRQNGGDPSRICTFAVTDGAAPNALHRKLAADLFGDRPNKIAVLTNSLASAASRGVATAFSWINPFFKSLPPDRWREGLDLLGLLEEDADPLLAELLQMQKELPMIATLKLFCSYFRTGEGPRSSSQIPMRRRASSQPPPSNGPLRSTSKPPR